MGLELKAPVRITAAGKPAQAGNATLLLETDELIVRGAIRGRVARADIRDVRVRGGDVVVRHSGGALTLTLGASAGKFAERLLAPPKSRLEKMGISTGSTVVVVGVRDSSFAAELEAADVKVTTRPKAASPLIVLGVHAHADLRRIAVAAKSLASDGALWVVHPKGPDGVKDTEIFAAGKVAGLTAMKVARFSETHTAEKLVVPKAARR